MKFRPCIDLHDGSVKQIVGSSLRDDEPDGLRTNFVTDRPAFYFATMYRQDDLQGGHIIKLGPGNDDAAKEALAAWPGGMQIGGGINLENCSSWLDLGASHVIVTSCVFRDGEVDWDYLDRLVKKVGRKRLVLDLSCRRHGDDYYIVTDRWQKFTRVQITEENLAEFSSRCDEFLIHAADVEGKCEGIEERLVENLGRWVTVPTTYAGGVSSVKDFERINELGRGNLDVTVGSALDIFGGKGMTYREAVMYTRRTKQEKYR